MVSELVGHVVGQLELAESERERHEQVHEEHPEDAHFPVAPIRDKIDAPGAPRSQDKRWLLERARVQTGWDHVPTTPVPWEQRDAASCERSSENPLEAKFQEWAFWATKGHRIIGMKKDQTLTLPSGVEIPFASFGQRTLPPCSSSTLDAANVPSICASSVR
jgi:hypothetical protein